MSSRWHAALCLCALAVAVSGLVEAGASKNLNDCPVLKALSQVSGGRQMNRPVTGASSLTRAGRGVRHIALSAAEVPATMLHEVLNKNLIRGVSAGAIDGLGNGLSRLTAGVLDLLTAPVPGATLPQYIRKLGRPTADNPIPLSYPPERGQVRVVQ